MQIQYNSLLNPSLGINYSYFTITNHKVGPVDYEGHLKLSGGSPKQISCPKAEASSPGDTAQPSFLQMALQPVVSDELRILLG